MNIDSEWIRTRLTGKRGEKAALARALGILPADVSKVLNGTRRVQANEIATVLAFFGDHDVSEEERQFIALLRRVPPHLREATMGVLKAAAQETDAAPGAVHVTDGAGK